MNGLRFTLLSLLLIGLSGLNPSRLLAQNGTTWHHGHSLTCASNDGKRHTCRADTSRGVILVNQRSGSACIQGQTWGYTNKGIWVDRGCRADFALLGKDSSANSQYFANRGETINCASNGGGRHSCSADTRDGVLLIKQNSGSPCIEGQTWGYTNNSIWVDKGCRATFSTGNQAYGYNGSQQAETITCASNNGGRKTCNFDTRGGVRLVQQNSGSPCVEGRTWGYTNNSVWVDKGCRATFSSGRR